MSFFRNFPKVEYDYLQNGVVNKITDIFRFVKPIDRFKDELSTYSYYQIMEGDRPDVVSYNLYGTPEYYWTFFIINEHLRNGIGTWPMSSQQFEKYMDEEYGGIVATCIPQFSYDSDGLLFSTNDSVAGRFKIGETITGFLSGATGTIVSKDPTMQQLVITNVTGVFQVNEIIRGNLTLDYITTDRLYDRRLAPHHLLDKALSLNGIDTEVHNARYIDGGTYEYATVLVTNYEYESSLNEQRAKIRVVKKDKIFEFVDAYQEMINL